MRKPETLTHYNKPREKQVFKYSHRDWCLNHSELFHQHTISSVQLVNNLANFSVKYYPLKNPHPLPLFETHFSFLIQDILIHYPPDSRFNIDKILSTYIDSLNLLNLDESSVIFHNLPIDNQYLL